MLQFGSWRWGRMWMNGAALTHTGNQRESNQDFFYLGGIFPEKTHDRVRCHCEQSLDLLAGIFDGFGNLGADAAHAAAALLHQTKISCDRSFAAQMEEFVTKANGAVRAVCREKLRPGGSTATIARLMEYRVEVCNLGDSPGYLFRGGKLTPLYVADHEVAYGTVIPNHLTQFLGMHAAQQPLQAHFASAQLLRHDRMLFCSDGLTADLSQVELEEILATEKSPEAAAELLLSEALSHSGGDNITILIINIL